MNKAFTKESDGDLDLPAAFETWPLPPGVKNYMTPSGERAIREELAQKIAQRSAKKDETLELGSALWSGGWRKVKWSIPTSSPAIACCSALVSECATKTAKNEPIGSWASTRPHPTKG